jgi:hypothetical protein
VELQQQCPARRPTKCGDRKVAPRENHEHGKSKDKALKMVATFAPVEASAWKISIASYVEDLRASLITSPPTARCRRSSRA